MDQLISNQGTLRLSFRLVAVSAVLLFAAALQANAAGAAYTGDTGHYLQMPQGYSQQAPQQQTAGGRPIFGGQGMGQGQASLQPLTVTNTPAQTASAPMAPMAPSQMAPTSVSSKLLPPEMAAQQGSTQAAVQIQQPVLKPQASMQQAPQAPMQPTSARIQAAATPSVSPQMLAAMEPASGPTVVDSGINVQMRGACGDGKPDNHRQAKGLNTSTTVFNDCLD